MLDPTQLDGLDAAYQAWQAHTLKDTLERRPERRAEFSTISGRPVQRVYTPRDLRDRGIGQVVGPLIFGWVLLSGNLTEVVNFLGYSYIGAMLILAVFVINHAGGMENRKPALSK